MIDELVPHAVLVLMAQEGLHHAAISLQDAGALRMTGGQRAEHLRHPSGNPTVATSPEEGHVGSVKEKAVPLLQLVEIGDHFVRSAVEVLTIASGAIGLHLHCSDHVHIVDPERVWLVRPSGVGSAHCLSASDLPTSRYFASFVSI